MSTVGNTLHSDAAVLGKELHGKLSKKNEMETLVGTKEEFWIKNFHQFQIIVYIDTLFQYSSELYLHRYLFRFTNWFYARYSNHQMAL